VGWLAGRMDRKVVADGRMTGVSVGDGVDVSVGGSVAVGKGSGVLVVVGNDATTVCIACVLMTLTSSVGAGVGVVGLTMALIIAKHTNDWQHIAISADGMMQANGIFLFTTALIAY